MKYRLLLPLVEQGAAILVNVSTSTSLRWECETKPEANDSKLHSHRWVLVATPEVCRGGSLSAHFLSDVFVGGALGFRRASAIVPDHGRLVSALALGYATRKSLQGRTK